jgi:hypothetical protein
MYGKRSFGRPVCYHRIKGGQ